jgi:hypothetical protein
MSAGMMAGMHLEFSGEIFYWRGPAPFYFVRMPEEESADLQAMSSVLSYGWGCIPVEAQIGETEWKTALIPKDGRYLVPLKDKIRKAEDLEDGDEVTIILTTGDPQ